MMRLLAAVTVVAADPVSVWTGRQMIVWGGATATTAYTDGATFTPR